MTDSKNASAGAVLAGQSKVWHRQFKKDMPVAVRGEGVWLFDSAGKKYLDASGGAAVSCLGHGHKEVIDAIHRQIDKIAYAHTSFFSTDIAEELAADLINHAPKGMSHAYFVSGGCDSILLKLASRNECI
jgi:adenosylmethionine-8-amino-7-oxononanoate aminotransferase